MPQMSPMNWIMMMETTLMMITTMMWIINFLNSPSPTPYIKKMKTPKKFNNKW